MNQIAMANALLEATNDILQSRRCLVRKKPTIGRAAAPDALACAHQDRRSARYRRLLNPTDCWFSDRLQESRKRIIDRRLPPIEHSAVRERDIQTASVA